MPVANEVRKDGIGGWEGRGEERGGGMREGGGLGVWRAGREVRDLSFQVDWVICMLHVRLVGDDDVTYTYKGKGKKKIGFWLFRHTARHLSRSTFSCDSCNSFSGTLINLPTYLSLRSSPQL